MSLRTGLEFIIHIDSFRNIDLVRQGVYQFRFTLFHQISDNSYTKYLALPYFSTPISLPKQPTLHCLTSGHIDDQNHTFFSNAFVIRYFNEEVNLGHIIQFRSEFDTASKSVYYLQIEMLFIELAAVGGVDFVLSLFAVENAVNLKSISKRIYKLDKVTNDIFSGYIPVVFDDIHYSILNLTVHSLIVDFKLRPSTLEECSVKDGETEPIIKIIQSKKTKENLNKKFIQIVKKATLADYLFADKSGKVTSEYADEVYEEYVGFILRIRMKLYSKLNDLSQKTVIKIKQKEFLGEINKREPFAAKCKSLDVQTVTNKLVEDLTSVSADITEMWHKYLDIIQFCAKRILSILSNEYTRMLNETFAYFIFTDKIDRKSIGYINYAEKHREKAKSLRESKFFESLQVLPIQDLCTFGKIKDIPLVFEDFYPPINTQVKQDLNKVHKKTLLADITCYQKLMVLVHGFQASSYDMRLIKNSLALLYNDYYFLCSSGNEEKTCGDIKAMGLNLAKEIHAYIIKNHLNQLGKISFIGHSLGGVIIRAALPHLEEYKDKMHTLLTLSSPHLGYLFHTSSLVNFGMWCLKAWQQSKCLAQLSLTDHKELSKCFLYQLAHAKVICVVRDRD